MRSRHLEGPAASMEVTVRPCQPGDEPAILRAHARTFARVGPAFQAHSLAQWRWQFAENPAGSRVMLAIDSAGEVRAQYAAVRQRITGEAGEATFAQAVDSFHARPVGAGLGKRSDFVRAGELFAESFCGADPEHDAVVWGLAIQSAWRVGSRRLGYEHVRTLNMLVAQVRDVA